MTSILAYRLALSFLTAAALTNHLSTGALLSSAQYTLQNCDSTKLIRCQQDVLRDMQTVSLQAASIQQPISGPPYSPKQQYQQQLQRDLLASPTTCRLVRSNLDCLLTTTPACYDQGIQTAQNTDIILRAKRFLEHNGCNAPDTTWDTSFCFRSPEIRSCEERYGFTNSIGGSTLISNVTSCLAYHAFKYCIETHLRMNCKVHEMDMANEYLIDRAAELTWRCPVNGTTGSLSAPSNYVRPSLYQLNNQPGSSLSPSGYNNFGSYEQRPIPTYVGGGENSLLSRLSNYNSLRNQQPWERFGNPLDESRFGISRYPGNGSTGEVFDRLIAANYGLDGLESSDCPVKAAPYARECEDTLMDQHRLARDSRDGNELQRRMCCALYQYRDCISRVVLDRCADSSPTAVEILMGVRRREMTLTCRGFNRDICSGVAQLFGLPSLALIILLTAFMTLKQQSVSAP